MKSTYKTYSIVDAQREGHRIRGCRVSIGGWLEGEVIGTRDAGSGYLWEVRTDSGQVQTLPYCYSELTEVTAVSVFF